MPPFVDDISPKGQFIDDLLLTYREKMTIINPSHYPGHHCASTGIRNIVNFHGFSWSEPICFGIGAGLGIWYMDFQNSSPSRMIHVRSADIEKQFFTRIGQNFHWEQYEDPLEAENALLHRLDQGIPVILQSDIYHLPYYDTRTHFPGHVITVWGYDRMKQVFYITDTERENILAVPFDNMRKARFCKDAFFNIQGNLYAPENLVIPENLPKIILGSILYNSRVLMDDKLDFQGVNALQKWKKEISAWKHFEDWKWTARFAYQVIEKRGTGGGGFRKMYSDFLTEASNYIPRIESLGLPEMMKETMSAWTGLALSLKAVSNHDKPDFSDVEKKLDSLEKREVSYHKTALTLE